MLSTYYFNNYLANTFTANQFAKHGANCISDYCDLYMKILWRLQVIKEAPNENCTDYYGDC